MEIGIHMSWTFVKDTPPPQILCLLQGGHSCLLACGWSIIDTKPWWRKVTSHSAAVDRASALGTRLTTTPQPETRQELIPTRLLLAIDAPYKCHKKLLAPRVHGEHASSAVFRHQRRCHERVNSVPSTVSIVPERGCPACSGQLCQSGDKRARFSLSLLIPCQQQVQIFGDILEAKPLWVQNPWPSFGVWLSYITLSHASSRPKCCSDFFFPKMLRTLYV